MPPTWIFHIPQGVHGEATEQRRINMSQSINKAIVIGNAGKDPEIRTTKLGSRIASFPLATSDYWKDKTTGESREKTEWHRIVVLADALIPFIEKCVRKGTRLYVEGKIETRKWKYPSGQDRYSTEIVIHPFEGKLVLVGEKPDRTTSPQNDLPMTPSQDAKHSHDAQMDDALNDEIPF